MGIFGNKLHLTFNNSCKVTKLKLLDRQHLDIVIRRLVMQLIEDHDDFAHTVLLGLQPRGIFLAERIKNRLADQHGVKVALGYLDTTFYRDDFRRNDPIVPRRTTIDFPIEDRRIVLIDDVLYTGRTVRSALDAMLDYGRPRKVQLLALIDRKYSRDLPVQPDYIGKTVNTIQSQRVVVQWEEQGFESDSIWLIKDWT